MKVRYGADRRPAVQRYRVLATDSFLAIQSISVRCRTCPTAPPFHDRSGYILGSGIGRDSEIAMQSENSDGYDWAAFKERSFESFRSDYQYLPKGVVKMEYTIRFNNVGEFLLPPSRMEAMYAPKMFGEAPSTRLHAKAER